MRSHPSEIRAKIENFRAVLANVTGAIVNVDALEAHGPADKTKTDVFLRFVHKRCIVLKCSNTVVISLFGISSHSDFMKFQFFKS